MRPVSRILLRLAVLAVVLAGPALAVTAQPADAPTGLEAFISTSPAEPTDTASVNRVPTIAVRPNSELPFYPYVRNSGNFDRQNITVVLSADRDGYRPLAQGSVANLPKGKTLPVKMTSLVAPAAPKAVPAAEKGDKAEPAKPVASPTPDTVYLLVKVGDQVVTSTPTSVNVRLFRPWEYVDTKVERSAGPEGIQRLAVTLSLKTSEEVTRLFRDTPAKVKLHINPALMPNLDPASLKVGTFQAILQPGGNPARLVAEGLRFNGPPQPESIFSISVDGYDRAFVYTTNFIGSTPTPITPSQARAWVEVPRYAIPGQPLAAKLEVYGEPQSGGRPKLLFFRNTSDTDATAEEVSYRLNSLRDQFLGYRVGDAGELIFVSSIQDWVLPIDTAGVYGTRKLVYTLEGVTPAPKPDLKLVTLDDTKPIGVVYVNLPPSRERGTVLEVFATGYDPESGIREVLFYLGEAPGPDGKPAPNSQVVVVKKLYVAPTTKDVKASKLPAVVYAARFDLPDVKGKVKLGVRFINNVGLAEDSEPISFVVVDPKLPRTVGDIKVRVIQGSTPERPQPNLPVLLRDTAGLTVAAANTNDKGEAVFKDLKPGVYNVSSVKAADFNAAAAAAVTVVADKEAAVTLELKR